MSSLIFGPAAKAVDILCTEKKDKPLVSSVFFKPYKSSEDVLVRTTAIVTDAPILAMQSAVMVLICGLEFFKAAGQLVIGRFSDSLDNLKGACLGILFTTATAIIAIFSPIINAVDLVGGLVNTVGECCANPDETEQAQLQP